MYTSMFIWGGGERLGEPGQITVSDQLGCYKTDLHLTELLLYIHMYNKKVSKLLKIDAPSSSQGAARARRTTLSSEVGVKSN